MISAKYTDGRVYKCDSFFQINFRDFVVTELVDLSVGFFVWNSFFHGMPRFHGLRTVMFGATRNQRKVYILVTDLFKIFVYDTGYSELKKDWVKDHPIYDEMCPRKPLLGNDQQDSIPAPPSVIVP